MTRENWFRLVAISLLLGILGGACWSVPVVRETLIFFSAMTMLMAIGAGIRKIRERDPYSLETLREMVLEGTYDEKDVPEVPEDADVYCMCCNHVYGSRFKVCPRCGK